MKEPICPTCGRWMPEGKIPVHALAEANLTRQQRAIVTEMIHAYPRPVSIDLLIDALWGDDPNGGPINARGIVHIQISHIRKKLKAHGWSVPSLTSGRHNRIGRYRLERLP